MVGEPIRVSEQRRAPMESPEGVHDLICVFPVVVSEPARWVMPDVRGVSLSAGVAVVGMWTMRVQETWGCRNSSEHERAEAV